MGNVRLYGATSGYTELAPPAVAPDGVLSLPSGVGTLLKAEGGKVLQVVRATDTTLRTSTSTSLVDVTGMSVTITPQKSTSAIIVVAAFYGSIDGTAADRRAVFRIADSSNNGLDGAQGGQIGATSVSDFNSIVNFWGYVTPATTSPVTYKLRVQVTGGSTVRIQNAANTGQMYAIEVSA